MVAVEQVAAALLSSDPLLGAPDRIQLFGAEALALLLLAPACVAAGFVTVFSPGLCRFLRTGAASWRVRGRHVGNLARPGRNGGALRTYRLLAAEDDVEVAEEVRRCLAEVGIAEAADGERDVVVLTDRTPAEWTSRDDLRDPLAVVATSIALPVRGAMQRFQWTDYRRRRRRTLEAFARDLAAATGSDATSEVPEQLQLLRLPISVVIVDWTLLAIAVLAVATAAYGLTLAVTDGRGELVAPAALCLAMVPAPFLLARLLRRRILQA